MLGHMHLQWENHSTYTHCKSLPGHLGKELLGEQERNSPAVVSYEGWGKGPGAMGMGKR